MKSILTLLLVLTSTILFAQKKAGKIKREDKILLPLNSYNSVSKKINNEFVHNYKKFNLIVINDSEVTSLCTNKKNIFTWCNLDIVDQIEVFDDSYILISFLKGIWHGAGPDYFPRDSVYILELKTLSVKLVKLPQILLVRSKNILIDNFSQKGKVAYQAIENIDFTKNQIFLIDQYSNRSIVSLNNVPENDLHRDCR